MARSLKIRNPRRGEINKIEQMLSENLHSQQLRRGQVILLYGEGLSGVDIAAALQVSAITVYKDLQAFAREGLACIKPPAVGGAIKKLATSQEAEILRIAQVSPIDLGLPYARWSLAKLRDYILKHRLVSSISREHLRRLLKKGALDYYESNGKSSALTHKD